MAYRSNNANSIELSVEIDHQLTLEIEHQITSTGIEVSINGESAVDIEFSEIVEELSPSVLFAALMERSEEMLEALDKYPRIAQTLAATEARLENNVRELALARDERDAARTELQERDEELARLRSALAEAPAPRRPLDTHAERELHHAVKVIYFNVEVRDWLSGHAPIAFGMLADALRPYEQREREQAELESNKVLAESERLARASGAQV